MNHGFRIADWAAELAAGPAAGGEAADAAASLLPRRAQRIPNPVDLRVYAVTDPDCNEKFGRGNAGGWVGGWAGIRSFGGVLVGVECNVCLGAFAVRVPQGVGPQGEALRTGFVEAVLTLWQHSRWGVYEEPRCKSSTLMRCRGGAAGAGRGDNHRAAAGEEVRWRLLHAAGARCVQGLFLSLP